MRTREQDRIYRREYRARKRREAEANAGSTVTEPASTVVQDAVRRELDPLPSTVTRPGLTATALRLAAILDDPGQAPHHPAAARALGDILATLNSSGNRSGTRLAAMRAVRRDEVTR